METTTVPENNETLLTTVKNYFKGWQGLANVLDLLGHLANLVGIGSHIAISLLPIVKGIVEAYFIPIAGIADPLIYCFRGTERIVRYVGRNYFNVIFEEEKHDTHPWQNKADMGTIILFTAAIILFFAASFPFHSSIAWLIGLVGVSINGYFDHRYPEIAAKKEYDDKSTHDSTIFKDYLKKYYSTRLYYGLIFSMVMLLILGSATGFGLPIVVDLAFTFLAKVGSVSLIVLNVARPINNYSPEILYKIHGIFPCWRPEKKPTMSSKIIIGTDTKGMTGMLSPITSKTEDSALSQINNFSHNEYFSSPLSLKRSPSPKNQPDALQVDNRCIIL